MKNFILIIAIALCLIPFGVFSATITVSNNNDSGSGSLRQAISDAVGGDEIVFNLGSGNETITLSLGQLTIDKNLTIDGSNSEGSGVPVTVDGNNNSRVFYISSGTVVLSNMTIQNGNIVDASGGGIYNAATLNIEACQIKNNSASTATSFKEGYGGGIYNAVSCTLTIDACTISDNEAITSGTSTYNSRGGGIMSLGTLAVTNSTITGNSTTSSNENCYGAGICAYEIGAQTTIKNSTICNNTSTGDDYSRGVGLVVIYGGSLILENSTISHNGNDTQTTYGAGIYINGNAAIRNTIIAQNINNSNSKDYDGYNVTLTDNGYNVLEYSEFAANATGGFNNSTSILYNTKYNDDGTGYSSWTQGGTAVSGSLELSGTLALNNSTNGTYTLALGTSSFAAGSRTTGIPPASNWNGSPQIDGSYTDQRGVERTANQNTSIGAYSENYTLAPMYCLDFDGANDYANCGSINLSGSAITLECWINVDAFQSSSPYISQIMGTESGSNSAFLRLGDGDIPDGNKIEFALNIEGQQQLTSNSTLETGRWYHIAGVYDGTNMKIYINGVEDASASQSGSFSSNSGFYIASNDGTGRYLDGKVDEARIWTVARSSTDLNNNMCRILAGNESGLTAYYRFDDGTSTTLTDATANSHNGTLYNMDNADWVNSYAMVIAEDASNITFNGFTANWDCPAEANSSFDDGYTIQYSTTSDFTSGNATTTASISETSKAITGLPDNTTYYYRVSGKRSDSETLEYSNVKSVTTNASSAPEYALDFDGSNDYVDCGTINLSGSAITLECWVNVDNFQSISPYISQIMGTESGSNSAFLRLGDGDIPAGNKIEFALNIGGQQQLTSISTLETGRWYHIAGVYDGSTMKIYINGVEDASASQSGSFTSNSDFYIASNDGSGRYLDGRVDEVRIWNDAHTPTEIQDNMCSRLAGTEDNLLAYYRFDNGSGTTLSDVTTNGHNGTLHNMDNADWINSYAMVIAEDATDITDEGFTANWSCPASDNSSYDDGYTIEYSTTSDFSSGNATTTALTSATSKSITGLTAATTYYYRVSGKRSGSGTLEYSNVKSFTTDAAYAPKYALDFERDNSQYANCGNINLSGSAITLECWIKPESFQTGSPYISQIMGTESVTNSAFLRLGDGDIPAGNKIQFVLYFSGGQEKVTSTSTLETGRWYHIAGVYDGSNMKIYINGVEDVSNSQTGSFTSNSTFYIAAYNGSDRYFDGTVDEVRVWKTARSSTDINTYMTTLLNGNETNLEAYYRCDNGSGTALSDITSNGHNASLVNTPSWPNSYAMVIADDATDVTDDSFTANWSCPSEANSSYDDGYTIQYSTSSDFSNPVTTTASASETSKSITGLTPSTNYYYRVSGKRSGSGTLEYSNVKSVTTSAPPAPEYCLDFDGFNDYISINSTMGLGATNVTIEAWVYISSTLESGTIARLGKNDTGFGIGVGGTQYDNTGNNLIVLIDLRRWINTNQEIGTGWHHVAFSVGSSNEVNIYLDGVNVYTEASYVNPAFTPQNYSSIAATTNEDNTSISRVFSGGKIDEVRYWGDVRTGTEIQDNMCSRLAGNEDNLAAYYRFDDGTGTTLIDATGHGYNGTLQNMNNEDWVNSYAMVLAEDATDLAENSFTANWSCVAEANSSFDGYRIEYSENQDFSASSTVDALVSETSKTITGLTAATTYYYRVGGIRSSTVEYSNTKTTATGTFSTVVTSNADNGGLHTLRYVIDNCDEGATITFNLSSDNETISLLTEDIDITKSLTIDGSNTAGSGTNVTVQVETPGSGGSAYRVFNTIIGSEKTVSLSNMTIKGGDTYSNQNYHGGSIYHTGGGTLELDDVTVTGSKAFQGGALYIAYATLHVENSTISYGYAYRGAGIYAIGATLTFNQTTVDHNSVGLLGGGLYLIGSSLNMTNSNITNCNSYYGGTHGGGISMVSSSNGQLTNCNINGNSATWGGGVNLSASSLDINGCSIQNNTANYGGGLNLSSASAEINNSLIYNNSSTSGGGINLYESSGESKISVNNSTIYGNNASSSGGGIYTYSSDDEFSVSGSTIYFSINNSTLSANTCGSGNNGAGIYAEKDDASVNNISITNSIITYNYKGSNYNDVFNSNASLYGNYNITGNLDLSSGTGNTNYSYSSGYGDPLFDSYTTISENAIYKPVLGDNGGLTETVALASNSIALADGVRTGEYDDNGTTKYVFYNGTNWVKVEDGSSVVSSGVTEITTDQRDETRHQYYPSIGSYEPTNYNQQWTGNVSNSWITAGNWSPQALPTASDDITIPQMEGKSPSPAIAETDTANCNDITVQAGAYLTIRSSSSGTGSLIIKGDVSNSGTITSQSYLPGSPQAWHMFSSPAECDISDNGWNPGANDDFYAWHEPDPGTWVNYKNSTTSPTFSTVNGGNDFVAGKGYLTAYNSEDPTKTINGTLNSGDINFPLACSSSGKSWSYITGWNLMGNPYSSSIDWNLADLSQFQDNYAYIYNPNKGEGGGFITVDGGAADAFIPPHQGFFAVATEAANEQNFTFSPAMQTHGNSSHIYKEKEAENSIVLILKAAQYYDETKIRIDSRSTWKRDRYDALKLFSYNTAVPQLYSLADDDISLAINGIPEAQSRDYMPLGLLLPEADHYEIALLSAEGSFAPAEILLEDKNTGTRHKLKSSSYHFNGEEGLSEDRFVLIFKGITGIDDITEDANINIWQQGNQIILRGDTEIKRIALTDITGRTLGVWESTENIPAPKTAGVYLVTVESENQRITKKIIIE